jgi:hypothetical protein
MDLLLRNLENMPIVLTGSGCPAKLLYYVTSATGLALGTSEIGPLPSDFTPEIAQPWPVLAHQSSDHCQLVETVKFQVQLWPPSFEGSGTSASFQNPASESALQNFVSYSGLSH